MKKVIVANWKMHPASEREAITLARAGDRENIVIAPPFPFLHVVRKTLKRAMLGAQDVFFENPKQGGAYTSAVSADMLKNAGVKWVVVGHSERRTLGETDAMINEKIKTALKVGLTVLLCVGENRNVRKKGLRAAERFVKKQLERDLRGIEKHSTKKVLIAYEPIWAIGTGKAEKVEETTAMIQFIKKTLYPKPYSFFPKVLYGGSVDERNIKAVLRSSADGVLVGGSSINERIFKTLLQNANRA